MQFGSIPGRGIKGTVIVPYDDTTTMRELEPDSEYYSCSENDVDNKENNISADKRPLRPAWVLAARSAAHSRNDDESDHRRCSYVSSSSYYSVGESNVSLETAIQLARHAHQSSHQEASQSQSAFDLSNRSFKRINQISESHSCPSRVIRNSGISSRLQTSCRINPIGTLQTDSSICENTSTKCPNALSARKP